MSPRPDVVVILTDQERAPPPYEDAALARWRNEVLVGRRWFAEHGVSFTRHYTGSLACVPSRPTLLTGHYPDVHGVTQTDGMAKLADDPRMRWLRPNEVPTLGHWFRAGGYDTHYDGKWHVSHADLVHPETGERLATNTADGAVLPDAVRAYLEADPLAPFGFSGWVGPEPHGARTADLGLVRDPLIANRVVAWLRDRYARRRARETAALRPFLLVVSFVNPHDVCFFPAWARKSPLAPSFRDPPKVPASPTVDEDLAHKPAAQAAYRRAYASAYGPAFAVERIYRHRAQAYRDLYLRLHAEVDPPLDRVREAVTTGSEHVVLVHTADHGELLGAHGGLHQKWFNLYDEATRVPFTMVGLGAFATVSRVVSDMPTSHVDLVPTLLSVAGLDEGALATELRRSFTEVHPLPGRDLSPQVLAGAPSDRARAVYTMTRDDVLDGPSDGALVWRRLGLPDLGLPPRIHAPSHVGASFESIVARVAEADGGGGHLWKLVRSFDEQGNHPDEWELYDLERDPIEAENRAKTQPRVFAHLVAALASERARAVPARNTPWPRQVVREGALSFRRERVVKARVGDVWAMLADFGAIAAWAPDVVRAHREDHGPLRVGSVRKVKVGPLTLTERVRTCEPALELAYAIEGLPPLVRSVENAWRLAARGEATHVTLTTTLEPRRFPGARIAGRLLGFELGRASKRMLDGLAAHLSARP